MKYLDIPTIKRAIERLQDFSANWLLPAFVFAANDVGTDELVDMSKRLGTDQFLDRYFNGRRVELPPMPRGNNLLRPRMKGITWDRGPFSGDYMIRQDTKMWGNLFSSRGYREMRLEGLIEGEKAITRLTDAFQARFEQEIPGSFRFEDFLVWLFAFEGVPDEVANWSDLLRHLLNAGLGLTEFKEPYRGRFKLSTPEVEWPEMLSERPTNDEFLIQLAPKLRAFLENPVPAEGAVEDEALAEVLPQDDPILTLITSAIGAGESLAFLLAGPPGTGKTRYARLIANKLTGGDSACELFLQFHPAIGYDDFMEGFRPTQSAGGAGITYKLDDRLFLNFSKLASDNPTKTYVAVIDELNRGDVARIFGEALTYLERDYRGVDFTLPFSGKSVRLPRNLILIATANPYDRSVTDLDDALLRRFWVVEIEPDGAVLRSHLESKGVERGLVNRAVQAFNILNDAFPHGFGHTNFLGVRTLEDLVAVWGGRVRMGLRRAFMHDRETFEATVASVEALLKTRDEGEAEGGEEAGPAGA